MTHETLDSLVLEYIRLNAQPGITLEELVKMYEDACKRIHALYSSRRSE